MVTYQLKDLKFEERENYYATLVKSRNVKSRNVKSRNVKAVLSSRAFTLIELVIVFLLIAISLAVIAIRTGTYSFWREEGFIRRISETLTFLHHQAVVDQVFYKFNIDIDKHNYTVGIIAPDTEIDQEISNISSDAGNLTLELSAFLSPSISRTASVIPPPSFPSLGEPNEFPADMTITDIRTMRGQKLGSEGGKAYILFSPRGFSEFAVIHIKTSMNEPITILVNPFSGNTQIYREYKDFEWTYGKEQKNS